MATIQLTKAQLKQINDDMDKQVEMLTDEEVQFIANRVNQAINIPFMKEDREGRILFKLIKRIDRKLYEVLPNEYYRHVKDAADGISPEEAASIEERITPLINKHINIPIIPEKLEGRIIGFVVGLIIRAMIKGLNLEE